MHNLSLREQASFSNFRKEYPDTYKRMVMFNILTFVRKHRGASKKFVSQKFGGRFEPDVIEDAIQALAQRSALEGVTIIRRHKSNHGNYTIRPRNSESIREWETSLHEIQPSVFMGDD